MTSQLTTRTDKVTGYHPKPVVSDAVLAVAEARTAEDYLDQLRALRAALDLSYARIGGQGMPRSTAHAMLTGDKLPSRKLVRLFLRACKVSSTEQTLWLRAWDRVNTSIQPAVATPPAPEPEVPAVQERPEPVRDEPEPPAEPRPADRGHHLHLAACLSLVVVVVTGCTVGMWLAHVPVEIIMLAYALIFVCAASWTAINRAALVRAEESRRETEAYGRRGGGGYGDRRPPRRSLGGMPRTERGNSTLVEGDLLLMDVKAARPVIGE